MDQSTLAWLSLVTFGFVFGLASGPKTLLRIGVGLVLLSGLGVLLATTSGYDRLAYWFVIGMVAVGAAFLVAMLGAVVGAAVRSAFQRRAAPAPVKQPVTALP